MRANLVPSEPVDEQDHRMIGLVADYFPQADRIGEPCKPDGRAGGWHDVGECADPVCLWGSRSIRSHTAYRSRAAVACDSAAAKLSAWATTSAPSAASDTRKDRSSLLAVPV